MSPPYSFSTQNDRVASSLRRVAAFRRDDVPSLLRNPHLTAGSPDAIAWNGAVLGNRAGFRDSTLTVDALFGALLGIAGMIREAEAPHHLLGANTWDVLDRADLYRGSLREINKDGMRGFEVEVPSGGQNFGGYVAARVGAPSRQFESMPFQPENFSYEVDGGLPEMGGRAAVASCLSWTDISSQAVQRVEWPGLHREQPLPTLETLEEHPLWAGRLAVENGLDVKAARYGGNHLHYPEPSIPKMVSSQGVTIQDVLDSLKV